jgi:uncharacterized protein YceH (UPF0502 family)
VSALDPHQVQARPAGFRVTLAARTPLSPHHHDPMFLPQLSLLETRVLGVLVEKQHTVPDTYPLTLNALVAGCNQKTSREPILNATEAEVQAVVDHLKSLSLVMESSGGRVMRYAHNVGKVLALPSQSVALLTVIMLRGPQTVGELRINCERLHHFSDLSAVEGFLHELATREAGALAVELPRQPGARETRWTHLLSGPPAAETVTHAVPAEADVVTVTELAALRANVAELSRELEAIKETVARLCVELGVAPPDAR